MFIRARVITRLIIARRYGKIYRELKIVSRAFENSMIDFVYSRDRAPSARGAYANGDRQGNYEIVINGE